MARKSKPVISTVEQVLDWFEDQADPIEQEYVLNYLARLQRRGGNGRTAQTSSNAPATGSASATRKPRATGAEAKSERQAKVSQPAAAPVAATSGPRRTGFGGSAVSTMTKQTVKATDEGDGQVDTE